MIVFVGFRGSFRFKLNKVFRRDKNIAITFENAVASFAAKLKNKSEKGTVIAPPEIPEIDPIPDKSAIVNIPKSSIPYGYNS